MADNSRKGMDEIISRFKSAPTIVDDLIYVGTGLGNLSVLTDQRQDCWSKDWC